MSLSTIYSSGVAMIRNAGSRIMATSTRTKVIGTIVVVNALGMRSANRIAKARTSGSGIARSAKIAAKTVLGLTYVVGTGFVDGWNKAKAEAKRKPSVKKAKRKAVKKTVKKVAPKKARKTTRKVVAKKVTRKFNRHALNRDMQKQVVPTLGIDGMRKMGLSLLKKHNAPASYRKEFLAGMTLVQREVRKMAKDSILHSATAPASANKFAHTVTAKRKYTKRTPAAAPVATEKA